MTNTPTQEDIERIPESLRTIPRWTTWHNYDDGKVPTNRGGSIGKHPKSNPEILGPFEEIYAAAQKSSQGIGFYFDQDDIMGVDLDDCIDDKGVINDAASHILNRLNSYGEITPSGHGLHIIVRATMPKPEIVGMLTKDALSTSVELYAAGASRYFTFTGKQFGTGLEVEHRQPHLDNLYSELAKYTAKEQGKSQAFVLDDVISEGNRNPTLMQFGRSMKWYGFSKAEIVAAGLALNDNPARIPVPRDTKHVTKLMGRAYQALESGEGQALPEKVASDRESALLTIGSLLRSRWKLQECELLAVLQVSNTERCTPPLPEAEVVKIAKSTKRPRQKREPQAKSSIARILNLCQDFEYFHTGAMAKPYVRLLKKGHHEVHTLESVKGIVRLRYLEETHGKGQPKRDDLTAAMDLFGARCSAGESKEINVRVAHARDAIYIDLGDDTWRAIEIKAAGWRIVDDPPVLFRRGAGALPLPTPVGGGDLMKLREIVNVSPDQFVLAAGWLLGKLNPIPGAAMAHMVLQGGPGSTKTTGGSILIRMLDPSLAPLTPMPKNDEDAMLAAQDCGVFGLDNISGCRASLSDVLCCFSTGAARKVRTLFETSGLTVEQIRRPVLINGIDAGFLRGDLADRSTVLSLPKVTGRRTDGEVEAAFVGIHAELLGAICDAAVTGLRKLPTTVLQNPPRMAAYCTWVSACEESLPWSQGEFLTLYRAYHRETNRTLLENDQLGSAIVEWAQENLAKGSARDMTMAGWLRELTTLVNAPGHIRIDPRRWPASPEKFSSDVKRVIDLLQEEGLTMEQMPRSHGGVKPWRLSRVGQMVISEEMMALFRADGASIQ